MFFLNQVGTVLEMGFIYAVVALGVYITYKILDFPDLSVDGTFPLGGVVFSVLLTAGCPWAVAMVASFAAGCAAGLVTGLLHVKLKINGLLSGIITMTALLSVNYLIAGGPMVSFAKETTLLQNGFVNGFDRLGAAYIQVALTLVLLAACKVALDLFLKTKMGFLLRATGDNQHFVTSLGRDQGSMKILGLAIGNGCTALSGSILAQQAESASVSIGTGMVVQALAAVIIGTSVFGRIKRLQSTTAVLLGTILYKAVLLVAMLWLPSTFLKLTMAILFVAALLTDRIGKKKGGAVHG